LETRPAADVGLRESHPAVWPLGHGVLHGLLVGGRPREVELQDLGHRTGIFAGGVGAFRESLEYGLDLSFGGAHRDDAVAELAGLLRRHRPGGRDIDRWRFLGHGP